MQFGIEVRFKNLWTSPFVTNILLWTTCRIRVTGDNIEKTDFYATFKGEAGRKLSISMNKIMHVVVKLHFCKPGDF